MKFSSTSVSRRLLEDPTKNPNGRGKTLPLYLGIPVKHMHLLQYFMGKDAPIVSLAINRLKIETP